MKKLRRYLILWNIVVILGLGVFGYIQVDNLIQNLSVEELEELKGIEMEDEVNYIYLVYIMLIAPYLFSGIMIALYSTFSIYILYAIWKNKELTKKQKMIITAIFLLIVILYFSRG